MFSQTLNCGHENLLIVGEMVLAHSIRLKYSFKLLSGQIGLQFDLAEFFPDSCDWHEKMKGSISKKVII